MTRLPATGRTRLAVVLLLLAVIAGCGGKVESGDVEGNADIRFGDSQRWGDGRLLPPAPDSSAAPDRLPSTDAWGSEHAGDAPVDAEVDDSLLPPPDAIGDLLGDAPANADAMGLPPDSESDAGGGAEDDALPGDSGGQEDVNPNDPCFQQGVPVKCDDGIACTTDTCTPGVGCNHTPVDSACDDGIACTTDVCSPGVGCEHAPDDGACDDGNICTLDQCAPGNGCVSGGTEPGPCEWPGNWFLTSQNPVLVPTANDPDQGADNVYAPDVLFHDGQWWMWYGGQGSDGHDAVFLAWSKDLVSWSKHLSAANPQPVLDHGGANHVNDPSVVYVGGTFFMYYTEAPTGENDRIHLATSSDGISWAKKGMVLDVGPAGSWEPDRVGRPSVLYEDGQFRMWYDGQIYGVARHVGYATSADGYNWVKHPGNPVLLNQGAVDVDHVGSWYVLLAESGNGTLLFVAKDPTTWNSLGQVFGKSGQGYDAYGQVTPFLLVDGGEAKAILFGGASNPCWCKNRIALALPGGGGDIPGCAGCLQGQPTCQAACQAAGLPGGFCGSPGSTNPDACCTCDAWTDCQGCLGGYADCNEACQHAGKPGGSCAEPSSTDPGKCCACQPDTGCEGCLSGQPSCMAACKAAGKSGGWCASPGSQNPSACCACF